MSKIFSRCKHWQLLFPFAVGAQQLLAVIAEMLQKALHDCKQLGPVSQVVVAAICHTFSKHSKGTEQAALDVARRMHQMFVCSAHNHTALPVCCVQVSSVDGRNHLLPAEFIAFAWYLYLPDSVGDIYTQSDLDACMLNHEMVKNLYGSCAYTAPQVRQTDCVCSLMRMSKIVVYETYVTLETVHMQSYSSCNSVVTM